MSISINLTEGELDLLLSSLNYLNEEQEVTLTHIHGSVRVIYDKLYFALQECQGNNHTKSLIKPHRPLNGFGNAKHQAV